MFRLQGLEGCRAFMDQRTSCPFMKEEAVNHDKEPSKKLCGVFPNLGIGAKSY